MLDEVMQRLARSENAPYIGEPVSQLEHALQCADLARAAGADDALIAAALLHDIGHLGGADLPQMGGLGVLEHERVGARYLERAGFEPGVPVLVMGHVAAKRYLVATRPAYAAQLSEASRGTLALQGGPMSAAEQREFEARPRYRDMLRLRAWDEQAKEPGKAVPELPTYALLLRALLRDG